MALGCYEPEYLDAVWKGVPFTAMDVSSEHGRRGAEGEFPFGENTAYQDMGRRIRRYSLRGRFEQNSHIADSSALIAACESRGPGTLIHPTRGIIRVACKSCKVSDNPLEEQGVTYVDLEFVEANEWVSGFNLSAFLTSFDIAPILTAGKTLLTNFYTPGDALPHRRTDLLDAARSAAMSARDAFNQVTSENPDALTWKALSEIDFAITDDETVRDSAKLADLMFQTLAAINERTASADKFAIFRQLANDFGKVSNLTNVAERSENAIYSSMRIATGAYLAQASLEFAPERLDEALEQYDIVRTVLEDEITNSVMCDDFMTHIELRRNLSDIKKALLNRAYNLPATIIYNFSSGVHVLVAAYEIYDNAKFYQDLLNRNPHQPAYSMGPEIAAAGNLVPGQ